MIRRTAALWVVVALVASGCAPNRPDEIVVSAASSLTEAFGQIAREFTASTAVRVRLNLGGTPQLVEQVRQRADVDVIATADQDPVSSLEADGLVRSPVLFARNEMEIAVRFGNPRGVRDVADLANPQLRVGLCDEAVPCGRYSRGILSDNGVNVQAATLEDNVKGIVTKIRLNELDAGIVYRSDLRAGINFLTGIEIPDADMYPALYPAAVVKASRNLRAAEFVRFLTSETAHTILRKHGFEIP